MYRKELVKRITNVMRENNIRKPVSFPKKVFHISDDEGNTKDFVLRKTDKSLLFTADDVDAMIEACLFVIEDALKRGESVSIKGFGTLGLKYRKPRTTKRLGTDEWINIDARYIPKFTFGGDLRMCAKVYELSLQDNVPADQLPVFDESDDETDDETDDESNDESDDETDGE